MPKDELLGNSGTRSGQMEELLAPPRPARRETGIKKQRATSKLAFVLADLRLSRCSSSGESSKSGSDRLLNALRADGVPGKFVRLLDDMNQRTTAAVRTSGGCTTSFEKVTGVRQGAVAGPFLFNFAIDDIMRTTVDQCPADIVLAPSGYESSTKLQHVVNLVSKLAAAYGQRLCPDKCKQMWISSRPRTGIRNNGSYERDVQQRCAKATSAFNSLTKCLCSTSITNEVKLRVYLSAIRPIMMNGSETWAAPSTVMERLDLARNESCLDGYLATFGLGVTQ
ncbi:hypothetical protein RB195_009071 [Necator americanus]|uniref:Reverse transcriptase domain-containing protein n=1 Tax=Necator americanus TaxID=51031 RepID=A0ABR1CRM1_NECAM